MSGADLVVFGEDWGRHPTSTQALVGELARDRRVLWVNSVGLRRPRMTDLRRAAAKLRAALAGGQGQGQGPGQVAPAFPSVTGGARGPEAIVAPLAVPLPGTALARGLNPHLWRLGIGRRAARMGLDRPILWVSLPTALDARRAVPHRALVYYCGDDFSALDGVDHGPVTRMEAELAQAADLIVVSHARLLGKFPAGKTLLLPHGVSVRRFASVAPPPPGPPVAGFLGLIDGRMDFDAVAAAARALPDWRFELIGPQAPEVRTRLAALARLSNLRLGGPVAPDAVPALLSRWTAALLPYRDTPMTRACDPLKLREYLAAGLPVAAFPFARGLPHAELMALCAPDRLAETLAALRTEPEGRRAQRRAAMATEDWSHRAGRLAQALDAIA